MRGPGKTQVAAAVNELLRAQWDEYAVKALRSAALLGELAGDFGDGWRRRRLL